MLLRFCSYIRILGLYSSDIELSFCTPHMYRRTSYFFSRRHTTLFTCFVVLCSAFSIPEFVDRAEHIAFSLRLANGEPASCIGVHFSKITTHPLQETRGGPAIFSADVNKEGEWRSIYRDYFGVYRVIVYDGYNYNRPIFSSIYFHVPPIQTHFRLTLPPDISTVIVRAQSQC